jgi:hypothetical protein
MLSEEQRKLRARHNGLKGALGADAPQVVEARRALRAATLAEQIGRIVDAAPPLTDEQRATLFNLLAPAREYLVAQAQQGGG